MVSSMISSIGSSAGFSSFTSIVSEDITSSGTSVPISLAKSSIRAFFKVLAVSVFASCPAGICQIKCESILAFSTSSSVSLASQSILHTTFFVSPVAFITLSSSPSVCNKIFSSLIAIFIY